MGYTGRLPKTGVAKITKQVITGDGGTSYSLDKIVGNAADIEVYVNNVRQEPNVAYTVTGTTIEFTGALSVSDSCYLVYQGQALLTTDLTDYYVKAEVDTAIGNVDLTNLAPDTLTLPIYATAPASPSAGDIYFNSTEGVAYHYSGSKWEQITNKFSASGGTEGTYTDGALLYKYHVFTSSGTFVVDSAGSVDVLIVAGGGGAGYDVGGGGGAGGLIQLSSFGVNPGNHTITVGAGGGSSQTNNVDGYNGANSVAFNNTALGGGGGGSYAGDGTGIAGGSGGGAGDNGFSGGAGTAGQGYAGGASDITSWGSAGGGGAGGVGANGIAGQYVAGGLPLYLNYTGSIIAYAGGGYGQPDGGVIYPTGQNFSGVTVGTYGFGANGTGSPNNSPYNGNAGIVIIRYPI